MCLGRRAREQPAGVQRSRALVVGRRLEYVVLDVQGVHCGQQVLSLSDGGRHGILLMTAGYNQDGPDHAVATKGGRPLGGHVLQRASVDDGLKPHVSAQRGSNKH